MITYFTIESQAVGSHATMKSRLFISGDSAILIPVSSTLPGETQPRMFFTYARGKHTAADVQSEANTDLRRLLIEMEDAYRAQPIVDVRWRVEEGYSGDAVSDNYLRTRLNRHIQSLSAQIKIAEDALRNTFPQI